MVQVELQGPGSKVLDRYCNLLIKRSFKVLVFMVSVHVKLATLEVNFVQKFEEAHLGNHLELLAFRHAFVDDGGHTIKCFVSELRVLGLCEFLEVGK